MKNEFKAIAGVLIFAVFIAGAYLAYNYLSEGYMPSDKTPIATGTPEKTKNTAPDFTVTDSVGEYVKLSDYFGKPIVLNFWASWCPPCRSEMPHFDKAYGRIGDSVQFIMVDLIDGQRETVAVGKKFIKNSGYSFPVYFDDNQDAASIYRISSIPTTIFIDKNGSIVKRYTGAMDEKTLLASIDLISE